MTHCEIILAIDVGTQSTRALAFTADGQLMDYLSLTGCLLPFRRFYLRR